MYVIIIYYDKVIIIMVETSSGMHSSQVSTILGMAGTNGRFYYQVRSMILSHMKHNVTIFSQWMVVGG